MFRVVSIPSASREPVARLADSDRVKMVAWGESTPSVPPDQTKAIFFAISSGEIFKTTSQQKLIRQGGKTAGKIIGSAIAFRLSNESDDFGGIDLLFIDFSSKLGDVAW